ASAANARASLSAMESRSNPFGGEVDRLEILAGTFLAPPNVEGILYDTPALVHHPPPHRQYSCGFQRVSLQARLARHDIRVSRNRQYPYAFQGLRRDLRKGECVLMVAYEFSEAWRVRRASPSGAGAARSGHSDAPANEARHP